MLSDNPSSQSSTTRTYATFGYTMALSTLTINEREQIDIMLNAMPASNRRQFKDELSQEIERSSSHETSITLDEIGLSFYNLLLAHYQNYCNTTY